jgi:hypothetical protein
VGAPDLPEAAGSEPLEQQIATEREVVGGHVGGPGTLRTRTRDPPARRRLGENLARGGALKEGARRLHRISRSRTRGPYLLSGAGI